MTARDDAVHSAVAPMLADLRSDLLVMPAEHVVDQHVDMMTFEAQVLATPRFVQKHARRPMPHPRRVLIAFVCAFMTLVSCGLSAAGALPAPLQHITETIAHTFGVPHTDHASAPSSGKAAGAPAAVRPAPPSTVAATPKTAPAIKPNVTPTTAKPAIAPVPTTTLPVLPDSRTQIAAPRPRVPSQRITSVDSGPRPSTNSSNLPPGFPSDWRDQAKAAAATQLELVCTFSPAFAPVGCPQQAPSAGVGAEPPVVTWTLLNNPADGAVVVAKTKAGEPAKHIAPTTTVTVYVAFQMQATYTEADGSSHIAYSAGIGAATMSWNNAGWFDHVTFSPGSVAGQLLPGVKPPSIPRGPNTGDNVVRSTVQSGFNACVAAAPAGSPVLVCPQTTAAGEQWTVTGDPTLGSTVAYDPTDGLYTVTGNYAMTSSLGNTSSGPYTATLFFDGTELQVLNITTG